MTSATHGAPGSAFSTCIAADETPAFPTKADLTEITSRLKHLEAVRSHHLEIVSFNLENLKRALSL